MHRRIALAAAALAAAILFAGCGSSGGGGITGTPPTQGGSAPVPAPTPNLVADSIAALNAAGSPVLSYQDLETAQMSPKNGGGNAPPNGTCTPLNNAGYEFFMPDKHGDANSTERIVFYDAGCTQPATDVVRTFTPISSTSETVNRTVNRYSQSNGSLIASRTEAIQYSNGSFDAYGYPVVDTGLVRTSMSTFNITPPGATPFTIQQDDEFIVADNTSPTLTFCADGAGVNAAGNFGFEAQTDPSNGTITTNPDGSVTFTMTRLGSDYPNGSNMTLQTGTPNASCPISAPLFTLAGVSATPLYTLPLSVQIANVTGTAIPPVIAMTVNGAAFPNGETLNVTTTSAGKTPVVINGTLSNSAGTISTFTLNGFGEGTLTMAGTGQQYTVDGWHASPTAQ